MGEGAITQADIDAEDETFGAVGYSFKRMFDGVWFDGVVVKILDTGELFTSSYLIPSIYLSSFLIRYYTQHSPIKSLLFIVTQTH